MPNGPKALSQGLEEEDDDNTTAGGLGAMLGSAPCSRSKSTTTETCHKIQNDGKRGSA